MDRYLKQLVESGALAAKPIPGRPRQIFREQDAQLAAQLRAHHDATLAQLCQQAHGVRASPAKMSRAIQRLGWTWKKVAGGHRAGRDCAGRLAAANRRLRSHPIRLR